MSTKPASTFSTDLAMGNGVVVWGPWRVKHIPARGKYVVQRRSAAGMRENVCGKPGRTVLFRSEGAAQARADAINAVQPEESRP